MPLPKEDDGADGADGAEACDHGLVSCVKTMAIYSISAMPPPCCYVRGNSHTRGSKWKFSLEGPFAILRPLRGREASLAFAL